MLIVLVGFAVGSLLGFKGGVIVVTGRLRQLPEPVRRLRAGALFDPDDLAPFDFTVNDFDVTFITEGREAGMATSSPPTSTTDQPDAADAATTGSR